MVKKMNLEEVIQELRKLNTPVPKPLRLPNSDEVEKVEKILDITLHSDFRKYLLLASDVVYGTLEPVTITVEGSHTDLRQVAQEAWEIGVSRSLLPICEDNADYFCMNEGGEIIYWSHNGISDEKWPDLATWIKEIWIDQR